MKQIKFILLTVVSLLIANVAMADDKPIAVEQLPAAAKTFVKTHFKGQKIAYAEKDGVQYECQLEDGTKIEFNRKGVWHQVESTANKAVPASIVPKAVEQYVKAHYQDMVIRKIDKERYGYEVELSNGTELRFNAKGKFIGTDR